MDELIRINTPGGHYAVRRAVAEDVAAIVDLIAFDQIARERDGGDLAPYHAAFAAIDADPAQLLVVATDAAGDVVGTLQLTFIPGLARRGALRAQIEAVRVHPALRGQGLGGKLMAWAIQESRRRGCALVQLTSDKRRERHTSFMVVWASSLHTTASNCDLQTLRSRTVDRLGRGFHLNRSWPRT